MKIGKFIISNTKPDVFVIAEIGNNHNGDYEKAIDLINVAIEAGANCVKFQMRNLETLYRRKSLDKCGDDLSAEYTIDLLKKFELTIEEQYSLKKYCDKKDILYLCTPWDKESIKVLEKMEVSAFKVSSADFTNLPLLKEFIKTKKPLIISTGMSTEEEIIKVTSFLNQNHAKFALLHCNSTYPAPFHAINLNFMKKLFKLHDLIGYSGHERGIAVSQGAVSLGAKIIERHLSLDRLMEGPDHAASLEPDEFKSLIKGIREIEQALGSNDRIVSQGEMINRENLSKSVVSKISLKKGTILEAKHIEVKSPGLGLSPLRIDELINKKLSRDMSAEDYFFISDINGIIQKERSYKFSRPWGIPVRYHDFESFTKSSKADLIEFHLSYSDLDLKLEDFFKKEYHFDFVVHAPELFEGSQLMDLATPDNLDRINSIKQTQRVIDITRNLNKYFPKTKKPKIVANIGGFTMDENLKESLKEEYYSRFIESLNALDTKGVEIIPQTMAPFPWHFGGQRYQNLFVHPEEIANKCEKYNLRICLDISHSCLTSNEFNYDFEDFLNKVGSYVAHLHLGDSKGVDGEGLQIGDGEIDFNMVSRVLREKCPNASFIPEIWQGHKNNGEGFWIALEKLQGKL